MTVHSGEKSCINIDASDNDWGASGIENMRDCIPVEMTVNSAEPFCSNFQYIPQICSSKLTRCKDERECLNFLAPSKMQELHDYDT